VVAASEGDNEAKAVVADLLIMMRVAVVVVGNSVSKATIAPPILTGCHHIEDRRNSPSSHHCINHPSPQPCDDKETQTNLISKPKRKQYLSS